MRTCTRPLAMVIALLVLAACSGPTDDGGAEPDGPATTSLLVDAKPRVLLSRTRAVELVDGSTGKVLHRADPVPGVGFAGLAGGAYYDGQRDEVLARALPGLRVVWQAAVAEGEQLAGVVPRGFVTDKLGEGSGELVGYTG